MSDSVATGPDDLRRLVLENLPSVAEWAEMKARASNDEAFAACGRIVRLVIEAASPDIEVRCRCCGRALAQVVDYSRSPGKPTRLCLDCYSSGCDGIAVCQR